MQSARKAGTTSLSTRSPSRHFSSHIHNRFRMENPPVPIASTKTAEGEFSTITEGKATVLWPKGNQVFYNPVQEVNRDLSIATIKLYQEQIKIEQEQAKSKKKRGSTTETDPSKLKILEALSATGLRSIRYAKEIPNVTITANDIDQRAVQTIQRNVDYNFQDDPLKDSIKVSHSDASLHMLQNQNTYDVVDIDPFGTAAPFLDSAVQSATEGGLLCITCTDLAVLAGNHPEACMAKYGATPIPSAPYCHEMALRIVLASIQAHANRHKRYVQPLMSFHIDFYVRIFLRVRTSALETKRGAVNLSSLYQCVKCDSFWIQPLMKEMAYPKGGGFKFTPAVVTVPHRCVHCQSPLKIAGPFWNGPLFDKEWTEKTKSHFEEHAQLYNQSKKILGLVHSAISELNVPLCYSPSSICNTLHLSVPPLINLRSALKRLGWESSGTHTNPSGLKTNAPPEVMWDIFRHWNKLHPAKKYPEDSPSTIILSKDPELQEVSFDPLPEFQNVAHVTKFVHNPENWGPGTIGKGRPKKQPKKREKRIPEFKTNNPKRMKDEGGSKVDEESDAPDDHEDMKQEVLEEEKKE
eukprot:TRINITY_DN3292_c1_g2_i1.p1 TRINITY_DN3292_c1_g2~~TRINITY_DN3292_c1_g2_i1.p1  ORF type:complete len:579 (-),score=156.90 TRINITY_DN3292_c1_g2_i1:37-1773(-)